ncbi:MAG: MerR family DNA-binding transcriptional regulator [Pseudomonadota bacterium]
MNQQTAVSYGISELASEFDITPRTIRFYEERGLLSPRRDGQRRLFSTTDRVRLALIQRGKRCGLSLEESREIIEMYEPGQSNTEQLLSLVQKIQERRAIVTSQMADLGEMMQELDAVESRCRAALCAQQEDTQP